VPPVGPPVPVSGVAADFYNRWDLALAIYGPADVPELDIQIGRYFAQRRAYLQAAPLFQRSLELMPGDPVGELDLINTYVDMGLADAAFALIKDMREHSTGNPLELAGVEALAFVSKKDFARADALLAETHKKYPQEVNFTGVMAELYRLMGERTMGAGKGNPDAEKSAEKEASAWYRKALAALNDQLQLIEAGSATAQEILMINRRRADLQMAIKDYEGAIVTFTAIARQDAENPLPLLGRAISELELGRLEAAKGDYQALERMMPAPSAAVYHGLAQVAEKQNDKAAEIRYDRLYLQHAPRNTLESSNVSQQLRKLEGR
jgi:tetratricopeptide (TPR) repeat protein